MVGEVEAVLLIIVVGQRVGACAVGVVAAAILVRVGIYGGDEAGAVGAGAIGRAYG